ncbi:MAG: hypothetical protein JWN37_801 [Candidatus Nomurabacteria bacterium]|nr:hypothetical protein [Candidatus Nomurabacteria bacterium]
MPLALTEEPQTSQPYMDPSNLEKLSWNRVLYTAVKQRKAHGLVDTGSIINGVRTDFHKKCTPEVAEYILRGWEQHGFLHNARGHWWRLTEAAEQKAGAWAQNPAHMRRTTSPEALMRA